MATQEDVRRIALALPETVEEDGRFAFSVRNKDKLKAFAWVWMERIHPKKARVPQPEVVALRVASLEEKEMLLCTGEERFFTEPHYNNFPAILVRLPLIEADELDLLVAHAWACQAPPALAREHGL